MLRYRAWSLFGRRPDDQPVPAEPIGYDQLVWADSPPAVADPETVFRERMARAPKAVRRRALASSGGRFRPARPGAAHQLK